MIGCAQQAGPETFPASGTILMDGNPVPEATVVFNPKDSDGQSVLASQAETDENGRFELRTYLGEDDYKAGIQPGDYIVTVTKLEVVQDMRSKPKHLLPAKYSATKTSDLSVVVSSDGDNDFELTLK